MRILANILNVIAPDSEYLKGRIRNKTAIPAVSGTPVKEEVYGDMIQAWQKMVSLASITENDLPDNETNDYQLLEALGKFNAGYKFTELYTSTVGKTVAGTLGINEVDLQFAKSATPGSETYRYDLHPACNILYAKHTVFSADTNVSRVSIYQNGVELITTQVSSGTLTKYYLIKKVGTIWIELHNGAFAPNTTPIS